MAQYPTGVGSFTTKLTNDVIQAAHINDLQAEITAIENALVNGGFTIAGALTVSGVFTGTTLVAAKTNSLVNLLVQTLANADGFAGISLTNAAGGGLIGIERSSGGGLFTGTTADALGIGTTSATSVEFATAGVKRATLNSAGNFDLNTAVNGIVSSQITNGATGTAAESFLGVVAGSTNSYVETFSQGFTTSGNLIAASLRVSCDGAAGIVYVANNAAGLHRWYIQTTERMRLSAAGHLTVSGQPGFLAHNSVTDALQATGATVDFDTEIYDERGDFATDTFTAPVTGRYLFCANLTLDTGSTTQDRSMLLVTSNRSYQLEYKAAVAAGVTTTLSGSVIADMDAGDTAVIQVGVSTGTISVVGHASILYTSFSGRLLP